MHRCRRGTTRSRSGRPERAWARANVAPQIRVYRVMVGADIVTTSADSFPLRSWRRWKLRTCPSTPVARCHTRKMSLAGLHQPLARRHALAAVELALADEPLQRGLLSLLCLAGPRVLAVPALQQHDPCGGADAVYADHLPRGVGALQLLESRTRRSACRVRRKDLIRLRSSSSTFLGSPAPAATTSISMINRQLRDDPTLPVDLVGEVGGTPACCLGSCPWRCWPQPWPTDPISPHPSGPSTPSPPRCGRTRHRHRGSEERPPGASEPGVGDSGGNDPTALRRGEPRVRARPSLEDGCGAASRPPLPGAGQGLVDVVDVEHELLSSAIQALISRVRGWISAALPHASAAARAASR